MPISSDFSMLIPRGSFPRIATLEQHRHRHCPHRECMWVHLCVLVHMIVCDSVSSWGLHASCHWNRKKKENCLFDFTYCKKYNLNSYFFNKKKTKNMLKNCAIGFRLESHSLAAHFACQRLRHQWHVRKIQMSPLFSMYPVPTRISLRKKTKLLLLLRANC